MRSLPSYLLLAQAAPGHTLDVVDLFLDAGVMAKLVFLVLAVMSVASWAIMISKLLQYNRATRDGDRFLDVFRRSNRFSQVNAAAGQLSGTPMVGLFKAGYAEIDAQVKDAKRAGDGDGDGLRIRSLAGVERTLRRAISVELNVLGKGTAFLATTAAAAPFIGLFGTVWGIMVAFGNIGATGNASLAAVAPGIAEALITTVVGLAVAIPAVIAYNHYASKLALFTSELEGFASEFIGTLAREGRV